MLRPHARPAASRVAAAINGVALGGGFEVALACHYRVDRRRPEGRRRPARGQDRPAARAAAARSACRGSSACRRTRCSLITEGEQIELDRPRRSRRTGRRRGAGRRDRSSRARQWILQGRRRRCSRGTRRASSVPGGVGQTLASGGAMTFMAGNGASSPQTTHAQLPAPRAPSCRASTKALQVPIDAGPAHRVEVTSAQLLAGPGSGRNLMRTLFLSIQGPRRQARAPPGRASAEAAGARSLGVLGAGMMGAGVGLRLGARPASRWC
ncbi:MAG: hypothetical protein MZV49_16560 [Rhodopseudomonas palustris]|nr:hypothetical protein [Rhodopseudomonas palustris]